MTKSEMFKQAHATAKRTVAYVGNYSIAFSLALKATYKSIKQAVSMKKLTKIEKAEAYFASVHGEYVPQQVEPAKKAAPTFWTTFDECDESGQL